MYIYKRNNTYHFRQRIPTILFSYFNKHEIHKSLKTSNIYVAKKYAKILMNQFCYIEKGINLGHLTKQELDILVQEYVSLMFENYEKDLYKNPGIEGSLDWRQEYFIGLSHVAQQTNSNDQQLIKDATEILQNMEEAFYDEGDVKKVISRLLIGYKQMALAILENMNKGVYRTQSNPHEPSFIKRADIPSPKVICVIAFVYIHSSRTGMTPI